MSIITTFENQCRALTSAPSPDENASRFLVGTQSLNNENLIYLFEYKDDNNSLAKVSFKFPYGESWHLNTSSKYPNLMTNVAGKDRQISISLFRLPQELENPIEDDYGLSDSHIEKVFDLAIGHNNLTRQCHWHPDDGDKLLICNEGVIEFWDINQKQKALDFSMPRALEKAGGLESGKKVPHVTDLRWSSLFNCSVVAVAMGPKIYGIDTRISDSSPSSICWLIDDGRCNRVRSIDFNPNSQYYLASGGDDCQAKFWDLRQTSKPSVQLSTHTHWIWTIRYNPFHDQLVLSAGSDARVALMRVPSIASEPFGQMVDYNDEEDQDEEIEPVKGEAIESDDNKSDNGHSGEDQVNSKENNSTDNNKVETNIKETKKLGDEIINVYEEHDDSVYTAEWATDPWIFASLGYESRLVINKVPKTEKYNILF